MFSENERKEIKRELTISVIFQDAIVETSAVYQIIEKNLIDAGVKHGRIIYYTLKNLYSF